jgi:uracil phosphoribosyltransferase
MKDYPNLQVLDHPLIQQKLFYLRSKHSNNLSFRNMLDEIGALMVYEVTRSLPIREREVETPLETTVGYVLANSVTLVPILRAGLAMCDGILKLIPHARVGHLGLYRDKTTLKPVEYYAKLPSDIAESEVIVVDPMLATGGSAVAAIDYLKERGVSGMKFVCLVAAPEGVMEMQKYHPDVQIFTAALDRQLNNKGYILPGLGDAGDRIYGTE